MPRNLRTASSFERDLKRVLKQGKDGMMQTPPTSKNKKAPGFPRTYFKYTDLRCSILMT